MLIFGIEIAPDQRIIFYKAGRTKFSETSSRVEKLLYYDLERNYERRKGMPHNVNIFADYEYNDIWNYLNENT